MNATTSVTIKPVAEDRALFCHYKGQPSPQPCYIELDCEERALSASYDGEIGNAIPFRVYHGRCIRWTIPCLTATAANALLEELAEEAARICDGYDQVWDGHNHVGKLDDDARAASDTIQATCEGGSWSDHEIISPPWHAGDWYEPVNVAVELKISAQTTDEELAEIVEREERAASDDGHEVEGIFEHLKEVRDNLTEQNQD